MKNLLKYKTDAKFQGLRFAKSDESLESNESSLEKESNEVINSKDDLGLDFAQLGKPSTVPEVLAAKAKKSKKKLKKLLDASLDFTQLGEPMEGSGEPAVPDSEILTAKAKKAKTKLKKHLDASLDFTQLGKPTVPDPEVLSPKAKKAKKKLKKILDAKNFVNDALKKEKGVLEDRRAKISANKKDYKDQQNTKRIARANLDNNVDNPKNDTETTSIPTTTTNNTNTSIDLDIEINTETNTSTNSNTSINNTTRTTKLKPKRELIL